MNDLTAQKQSKSNLPAQLKANIEAMSGFSMDDVRVHYNSSKPAQMKALAYTQGTDIHVGPGQEKHLGHEAWHVVQQKQGRVAPTAQLKGVNVNTDSSLEHEADVMGARASVFSAPASPVVQRKTADGAQGATVQFRFNEDELAAIRINLQNHWRNYFVNKATGKISGGHNLNSFINALTCNYRIKCDPKMTLAEATNVNPPLNTINGIQNVKYPLKDGNTLTKTVYSVDQEDTLLNQAMYSIENLADTSDGYHEFGGTYGLWGIQIRDGTVKTAYPTAWWD
ncbi:MAG: DUF4157 domain-containing protein [Ruminococcus sp.]|nr:DUF4157 domain-containing protein [Ruminococcus sp.]